jgi:WD40 repeat protein
MHNTLQGPRLQPGRPDADEREPRRQNPRLGRHEASARAHHPARRRDSHSPVSPDGNTITTGDLSGNVNFWDARTGLAVGHTLGEQNGLVGSVAYLAQGRELVTTSGDGKLRLWDVTSGHLIGAPLPGANTCCWGTSFPDGKHAISVFGDGTGVIWSRPRRLASRPPDRERQLTGPSGTTSSRPCVRRVCP